VFTAHWFWDREVVKYSELRHLSAPPPPIGELWAIYLDERRVHRCHRHIGNLRVAYDIPNAVADLSILIGERDCWGHGYGFEAWNAMLGYLLETQRKVTAGTMACNTAMTKIFNKSNMVLEGVRRRHFLLDGREVDCLLYAKFRVDDKRIV